jgi:hypothetical protein
MFYITDYITRMEQKTYQTLSLPPKAVTNAAIAEESAPIAATETILHKCLTQFAREASTHAQQAAHYLCGLDDDRVHVLSQELVDICTGAVFDLYTTAQDTPCGGLQQCDVCLDLGNHILMT